MRYRVRGAGLIRSENAAKPPAQKSKFVAELIRGLPRVEATLDYGAGKLRYLDEVMQTTDRLTVVDSTAQLERVQTVFGEKTSVREYLEERNSISVKTNKELIGGSDRFDRVFLMNVLQIVPIKSVRKAILRRLFDSLDTDGQILVSVQYRNSDFSRMARMPNAKRFRDGMLIEHLRGTSFYGFIMPKKLQCLVAEAGFCLDETKLHEGSCFIWASKRNVSPDTPCSYSPKDSVTLSP